LSVEEFILVQEPGEREPADAERGLGEEVAAGEVAGVVVHGDSSFSRASETKSNRAGLLRRRIVASSRWRWHGRRQCFVRRWALPNGSSRRLLSFAGIVKDRHDIAAEFLGHALAFAMDFFDRCIASRFLQRHQSPFLPVCK
jgi:hypothetical protein